MTTDLIIALDNTLQQATNSKLTSKQLTFKELQNLTFEIEGLGPDQPVSVFHYLFFTGQKKLFDYLVENYQGVDIDQSQLTGPPLILIVIRLYLDPDNFGQYYQINYHFFEEKPTIEFYWLFFQSLLRLGWYWVPREYRLIEICLEIVVTHINQQEAISTQELGPKESIQKRLIKLYQALYEIGFQIGLRSLFKNRKIMSMVAQSMPSIYEYVRKHYSATLIQSVYRGYRTRRLLKSTIIDLELE